MSLHIQLDKFEGPLGLLLYLIRKEEMDIFDINVHHITTQYLEYIKVMKKLDLEVAGEFVSMAATLIHIKSRMLLPRYNEEGEIIENEDPRRELVQKLLEYQRFQEVAQDLYQRPLLGRDIWVRGSREKVDAVEDDDVILEDENPLFALIKSYRYALKSMKKNTHKVLSELQSIAERVMEMKQWLIIGKMVLFNDLLDKTKLKEKEGLGGQVLITFLSLLELSKLGFVSVFQSEACGDIYVTAKKEITANIVDRVEDYESNMAPHETMSLFDSPVSTDEPFVEEEAEEVEQLELSMLEDDSEDIEGNEAEPVKVVEAKPEDEPFIIEAATDDEILEEEEKLNLSPDGVI